MKTSNTPLSGKPVQAVVLALIAIGLLLVPKLSVGSGIEFTADILIYAIMAIGLYVQLALLGLVNFGFSAFFGLGGYLGAIFLMRVSPDLLTSFVLTAGCSALVAALFGLVALKTKATAFTMITLTFSQLLYVLAVADDRWTGGVNGLTGVPRPRLPVWLSESFGLSLESDAGFYYLSVAVFAATVWLVWVLKRSRLGSVFAGIRENEERMVVLGYPVQAYKLAGFVISGVIGGYAGYMNAMLFGYVGPGALFWTMSGEALLMVIVGGTASLAGPIVGAAVFIGISHYAVSVTDHWRLYVGLAFIAIVLFAPQGLVKILRDRLRLPQRKGGTAQALTPVTVKREID
ncbi:MAG: branched-chain amino acid ABC transporter permease [Rhodoferax sp.]|uniref:branched-chain amino acid ABC transporter permease n=1 Tax=Rhodoferax sp. TaxID=50421 RepID=UPI0027231B70|nr:branched-chain amino acid ABC transporter permease [Rhodoferax sp.]MDO8451192.1 branched-chain amino acid ABC transporter permease [Rhodoferax sp.]